MHIAYISFSRAKGSQKAKVQIMKIKKIGGALLALLTLSSLSIPAYAAEGQFGTYLSGVRSGFRSRNWTDQNRTTNDTTIFIANCRSDYAYKNNNGTMNIELRQDRPYAPDRSAGVRGYPCARTTYNTKTNSWGRQAKGNYFFKVTSTPGNLSASSNSVSVSW